MRILEIETFGRGGLTQYAHHLSLALAERGHDVTLFTGAAYELEGWAGRPPNFRVAKPIGRFSHRTGARLPGPVLGLARKLEAIVDAFVVAWRARRLAPDVIHLHCTNPVALLYLWLLCALGPPVVVTAHVVTPHEPIPLEGAIYRRIHRLGRRIVAHTRFDQERLTREFGVDLRRTCVIPCGRFALPESADASRDPSADRESLGLGPGDAVALLFGYIREYKGLDVLLDAWPAVAKAVPDARLVVAGDPVRLGPARLAELKTLATRVGAVHRFEYIPIEDVDRYFAAADVVVMPYRHISQSAVLMQSLASGVPVVASRVGGIEETIGDGESGLLVPPESAPALADALIRILGDAELRRSLADGARRVADRYAWPSIAARTEEVFADLVAERDRLG